jgi:O-antigen ligase
MSVYALASRGTVGRLWLVPAVVAAALGIAAVAVVSPPAALALVLGLGFVFATFRDFTWGVALFTVIAFFDRLPGVGGLESTAAKAAGAVLAAVWLIRVATRGSDVPLLTRAQPVLAFAAAAFVCWAFMSSLWAEDSASAISSSIRLALNVLLLFIVFSAIRGGRDLRLILGAYIAGAAITALVGLAGGTSSEEARSADDVGRLAGQIGDPNEFAAVLVPALVFAAFLLAARGGALLRWALVSCVALFGIGLFLTNSRGGLVALAVTFVVTLFLAGPVRSRAVVVILLVGALGFAYYTLVAPPQALQRITQFSSGGGTGREDLWTVAAEIWRDHPLTGIGIGNFKLVEPRYALTDVELERVDLVVDTPKVAHNTYLHVLTELGLVGFAGLAIVVLGAFAALRRAVRAFAGSGDVELEVMARGIAIATIGVLAAFTFISAQYEKQLWLLLGLAAATATVARRGEGAAAEEAYDLDVREELVERLEQRVTERMDALFAEQERLTRRRAQLAAREQELKDRLRELDERTAAAPERAAPDTAALALAERERTLAALEQRLAARERELEERAERLQAAAGRVREAEGQADDLRRRAQELDERAAALTTREEQLQARVALVTAREQELARRAARPEPTPAPAPVQAPVQAPPPEPAAQPAAEQPAPVVDAGASAYNLSELEALVERNREAYPDRAAEWDAYLFTLRPYAAIDGAIPQQFSYLVEEAFADLLGE